MNSYDTSANAPLPKKRVKKGDIKLIEVSKHRSFPTLRSISALILREVQTSNSKTSGGYLWAIAEPVGGIILLTLIFSAGFRSPPLGNNFAIFYATGIVPFMAYLDMSNKVANSIKYSKGLLAYPAVTFSDALFARIIFNTITQIVIAIIIFIGILYFMETRTDPDFFEVAIAMSMVIILSSSVGAMNCFLFEAFAWWQPLWGILMRPLFLLSCVFFIFDNVPAVYQDWLWWNPLVHIVGQMRYAFYPNYEGEYVSYIYVFGLSLFLFALGLALLIRYHRDLQNS